jgi:hypothetical protein
MDNLFIPFISEILVHPRSSRAEARMGRRLQTGAAPTQRIAGPAATGMNKDF